MAFAGSIIKAVTPSFGDDRFFLFCFCHTDEILRRIFFKLFIRCFSEAMPLIEADRTDIFLKRPQKSAALMFGKVQ